MLKTETMPAGRLESLDALRGFDLFFLVALGPVVRALAASADVDWLNDSMWMFRHFYWEGFSPWDLVMPLFLFMAGASVPFAFSRYKAGADRTGLWARIARRIALLWVLGMVCQGNLLGLDTAHIYFYSNTLQSIATGYLITVLLFLFTSRRTQALATVGLLVLYWALMQFVCVDGYGGGNYTPDGNLAEWVDRTVLGRFRDGAEVAADGSVVFEEHYRYTWILSSLNFAATVLTGLFAGYVAKDDTSHLHKLRLYLLGGTGMVALGLLWNMQMPIVKTIWTSSMVLFSSGCCFLLMGLFYYWIDYKGHRRGTGWLKVYGMNSIVAYMVAEVFNFRSLGASLLYGLEQYTGAYYSFLLTVWNAATVYAILYLLYRNRIFLKV